MKTIEESARDYAIHEYWGVCEIVDCDGLIDKSADDFKAGVEFAQQWIPCEEELPEINQNVLICDDPQDNEDVRICYRRKDHWTTDYVWDNCERPAYWRPITLK